MVRFRAAALGGVLATTALMAGAAHPPLAIGAEPPATVTAYLDGVAIPLEEVSKHYCDDFSYPVITCSSSPLVPAARTTLLSLLSSVEYVTVFDLPSYAGSFMNVSQDYGALVFIGWNDRISSFKARNGETGAFFTDWLYNGSQWSFCCNQQLPQLGAYNNTFSSIMRT
jgi:hypothetical protein